MRLTPLGEMDLAYVGKMSLVDYGPGGQFYAHMEGTWQGERISGKLRLTNLAQKRADDVNTPALRGVLETNDGATLYVEMNGISQIEHGGRAFIDTLTLRTADPRYTWANTTVAIVEGELHGSFRPGETRAHCWVYACEATLPTDSHIAQLARVSAYVVPIPKGEDAGALAKAHALHPRAGIMREAAFIQPMATGSSLIIYRELDDAAFQDNDPSSSRPKVELLLRHRATRRAKLYATALPLLAGKTARVHEFALELGGIHATEFEESLRRQSLGLTLFIQHLPELDLLVLIVEGDEPAGAIRRFFASQHPFDRWFVQRIGSDSGLDLPALTLDSELLWSWDSGASGQPAVAP